MIRPPWLDGLPDDVSVVLPAPTLKAMFDDAPPVPSEDALSAPASWREKLWTCDPATRLSVGELAEGIDRPPSYIYAKTGPAAGSDRIPHRRIDGRLVFVAGEVRTWLEQNEEKVVAPQARVIFPLRPGRRRRRGGG